MLSAGSRFTSSNEALFAKACCVSITLYLFIVALSLIAREAVPPNEIAAIPFTASTNWLLTSLSKSAIVMPSASSNSFA